MSKPSSHLQAIKPHYDSQGKYAWNFLSCEGGRSSRVGYGLLDVLGNNVSGARALR